MNFERRLCFHVPQLAGGQLIAVGVNVDPGGRGHDAGGTRMVADFPTQISGTGGLEQHVSAQRSLSTQHLFSYLTMLPCLEFDPCAACSRGALRCNAMMLV
jgi:hypothetical protein